MSTDPQPRPVVGQPAEEPIPLKQLLKLLSVAALDCGTYPGDLNSEEYSRLCDREQIARARIIAHFDFAQELTATTIARLREELEDSSLAVVKLRTALNQIAHPTTYGTGDIDPREIARRTLILGMRVPAICSSMEERLTAYGQAADAVLKAFHRVEMFSGKEPEDSDVFLVAVQQLAAAHRTATAHDGEREK